MDFSGRLKLIRESLHLKQDEFATRIQCKKSTYGTWERGSQSPNALDINKLLAAFPYISPEWLLTGEGEMRRLDIDGHVANGNNIIQGAHIDAEDVHLILHQVREDQAPTYSDPIDGLFLKDWKSLSDVGKMRVWTLLKEEIQREKEK